MINTKHCLLLLWAILSGSISVSCGKAANFQRNVGVADPEGDTRVGKNIILITQFGAVGDGNTLNTKAIQRAIDSAHDVNGTVVVPRGDFLCGPLTLPGNTTLVLQTDAILKLRNDIAQFPVSQDRYLNFITATKVSHIKIIGHGTIDGQGKSWWQAYDGGTLVQRRPQLIYLDRCTDVVISGIHTLNPPNTHFSVRGCKDVTIDSVTITAPADSHNTDGINISGSNILIEHCDIRTGDDNIAINVGSFPSRDIVVKQCTFGYGHGLSIGSHTSGGLDGLTVDSCTFRGTTSGIRMKSNRERGGVVQNLSYSHITMTNVRYPIYLSSYYPHEPKHPGDDAPRPVTPTTPIWKRVTLTHIHITHSQNALIMWGLPEQAIENIQLTDVDITADKGMLIYNAKDVKFDNCTVTVNGGDRLKTYHADVSGL